MASVCVDRPSAVQPIKQGLVMIALSLLTVATVASARQGWETTLLSPSDDNECLQGFDPLGTSATKYLTKEKDALCLDGSPGAFYFQPGTGNGTNKWYIHHQGGGWCESMDDCLSRSKSDLGSSKKYPATADLGGGYFSNDCGENPLMCTWNKVLMRYCDGASFSGNNLTVAEYKGAKLHWRGKSIREDIAAQLFGPGTLSRPAMSQATDLVVSGCSAGGLATYLHTDQWCDQLKSLSPSAKCVGLPDSGFFLDYQDPQQQCSPASPNSNDKDSGSGNGKVGGDKLGNTIDGDYHCGLKWTFFIQNATAGINQACVAAHKDKGEQWKCMFAEHSAEHIRSPVFAMQSQYDSWQTGNVQGHTATTQALGNNITARLESMLLANNKDSGAFLDSCHHHCGAWNTIRIDGDLVSVAIQKWYNSIGKTGAKKLWNQNKPYPCDACCKP